MIYGLDTLYRIPVGRAGENLARTVRIDVKPYLDMWPSGRIEMIVQRPGEESFYPADIEIDSGILRWAVTAADTAIPGVGKLEIRVKDGEVLAKSMPGSFVVGESVSGTETDPPEPVQGWVDDVLDAAARAEDAAKRAEDAAAGGGGSGGITVESDPTVPDWAKEPEKPRYTAEEVGARPSDWLPTPKEIGAQEAGNYALASDIPDVPTKLSEFENDAGYLRESNVLIGEYDVTPYEEIKAAMDAGREVVIKRDNNYYQFSNRSQQGDISFTRLYRSDKLIYSIMVTSNGKWDSAVSTFQDAGLRVNTITAENKDSTAYYPSTKCLTTYAVPIPSTAEAGQAIVVKAVDSSGKPTEWGAVGMVSVEDFQGLSAEVAALSTIADDIIATQESLIGGDDA